MFEFSAQECFRRGHMPNVPSLGPALHVSLKIEECAPRAYNGGTSASLPCKSCSVDCWHYSQHLQQAFKFYRSGAHFLHHVPATFGRRTVCLNTRYTGMYFY